MILYRNISMEEFLNLKNGAIKGKLHKESKDSDYSREKHGEVVFFFENEVNHTHVFKGYDLLIKVDIPEENIIGRGLAQYTSRPSCDCCEVDEYSIYEYYVSEYSMENVIEILEWHLPLPEAVFDELGKAFSDFSIYLIWEKLADDFLDNIESEKEQLDIILSLSDSDIENFLSYGDWEYDKRKRKVLIDLIFNIKKFGEILKKRGVLID